MGGCTLPSCAHRTDVRLFTFPKDKIRRQLWLSKCNLETVGRYSRLCELHFDDTQFELKRQDGWKRLKFDAVPTVFPEPIRIFRMFQEESEPAELIEVVTERTRKKRSKAREQNSDEKECLETKINAKIVDRVKSLGIIANPKVDSLFKRGSTSNESAVSHFMSEHESLLDDIERIETANMEADKEENSSESCSADRIIIKDEIVFESDNDETIKKYLKQKRKSHRTVSKKDKAVERRSVHKRSSARLAKMGTHAAETAAKSADPDQFIALLKQWNELLKQELIEFENKHKNETIKNEILLETLLELETENKALKFQKESLEQEINEFVKNNKEMSIVICELEKHNRALASKVAELQQCGSSIIQIDNSKQKVKELESQNKVMVKENKAMLEEVEEFVKCNKNMHHVIVELKKNNKAFFEEAEVAKEKVKAVLEEKAEFLKNNHRMNQVICELGKQNKALGDKLEVVEIEKKTMTTKIVELEKVAANLKKGYLDVLKHPKQLSRLQQHKRNVEEENKSMLKKIVDLEKVIEDLIRNDRSSNVRIEITKLKGSEVPKPDS